MGFYWTPTSLVPLMPQVYDEPFAGLERELVGQRHERARRHLHPRGMRAVPGHAVHDDALDAELRPAHAAVRADAAAGVVVVHDALAVGRLALGHGTQVAVRAGGDLAGPGSVQLDPEQAR